MLTQTEYLHVRCPRAQAASRLNAIVARSADVLARSWLTLGIGALVCLIFVSGGATLALQLDRSQVAGGQWWRLVTGHVTHWSADHLFWDLLAFVALGVAAEVASRKKFIATLLAGGLLISGAVLLSEPEMQLYRGLSGLDSALFALVAATWLIELARGRAWQAAIASGLILAGFAAKTAYEAISGQTVFVDCGAADFIPLPIAHAIGAVTGLVVALMPLDRWQTLDAGHRAAAP